MSSRERGSYDDDEREEQDLFDEDNNDNGVASEEGSTAAVYTLRNDGVEENRSIPGPLYVQSAAGDAWELTWVRSV